MYLKEETMDQQDPNKQASLSSLSLETDIDKVPLSLIGQMSGYWRSVVEVRKKQHEVSFKRILLGQLITIFVVGLVSFFIESSQALLLVGATLLLYPALTDLLLSSGAVLSAIVHHDMENQDESSFRFILLATIRSVSSTVLSASVVGIVAATIAQFALGIPFIDTLQLTLLAASIAAVVGLPAVLAIAMVVRRIKSNPDEVIPPFESSAFNIIMLLSIAIASRILS